MSNKASGLSWGRGRNIILKKIPSKKQDAFRFHVRRMSGKKKLSLQEVLDLLQNLPCEIYYVLTDDFSYEEVPTNNLLEFSLDSQEDD
ncbi:hypothetical protein TNCV_881491 [Trichonephila clavipes]|nr:hypothetical protein TNCV_881491 [Trichonephila clavipes]